MIHIAGLISPLCCSVDTAKEMGMELWVNNPAFSSKARQELELAPLARIEKWLDELEGTFKETSSSLEWPGNTDPCPLPMV